MRFLDPGSLVVMAITLVLFVAALFAKGFTHDLLLEAGVFLVSVKLIIQAYKSDVAKQVLLSEILEIKSILQEERGGEAGPTQGEGPQGDAPQR